MQADRQEIARISSMARIDQDTRVAATAFRKTRLSGARQRRDPERLGDGRGTAGTARHAAGLGP